MIKNSIWNIFKKKDDLPLTKNLKTDILIVGSGITGITLSYLLKDKKVTVIDDSLGKTTCKSTAKITYLQDTIYNNISKSKRNLYLDSQIDAIKLLKTIIYDNNIKCDLEEVKSYLFTNDEKEIKKIKKIEQLFLENNIPFNINDILTYPNIYNISINDSYVFNPCLYLESLKKIVKKKNVLFYKNRYVKHDYIYNNYEVTLDNDVIITCNTLVFACHYPPFLYPLLIPFKVILEKSYVSTSLSLNNKYSGTNTNTPWQSFRYYQDNLIYLTNSHTVGNNLDNEKEVDELVNKSKTVFNKTPNYIWTNNDLMSYDHLPIVGPIKKFDNTLLISTAYNTWGMTNGVMAANVLKDIILNNENKYIKLFSPQRSKSLKDYLTIMLYSTHNGISFIKSKFKLNYSFYKNVEVRKVNGIRYGIFTDKEKKEHIVLNKCPHMKCNLVFNEFEETWDCPCHASRFDIDGNVIKGPSVYNIKVK